MRRVRDWLVLALASVWLLAGCDRGTEELAEIRLGVVLDEPSQVQDASWAEGAELLERQVAEDGGLTVGETTYALDIVFETTDNTPEGSVRAALNLINQHHVLGFVGPSASRSAIPVAKLAQSVGVPVISPASTHPETTLEKPYSFRLSYTDPYIAETLAHFVYEDLALRRAAVFFEVSNPYGASLSAEFARVFEGLGGQIVAQETYLTGATDFRPAMERLVEAQPEVLFLPNGTLDVRLQAQALRALDDRLPILGSDVWNIEALADETALEGAFLVRHWHAETARLNPQNAAFMEDFAQSMGFPPREGAALAYDCLALLVEALKVAGTVDSTALRDALAATEDFRGVTGRVHFRGTGGDPLKPMLVVQMRGGDVDLHRIVEVDR